MHKLTMVFIALLELGAMHAHAQKLFGFVVEQNSGSKPVPGVMVKARFANQTATTEKGTFTLTFQNAKPGDNAVLVIEKDDWVIVEKSRLEVNLPADPFNYPHTVVICKADEWAKANRANYQLLDKMVREALSKQKSQLNKQSQNYQKTIDSLEDQFIKTQGHLSELTDALSRVNLDDVSETEKAAYAYFAEGKIDEAVLLRGTLQSEKNLLLATQRLKELANKPVEPDSSVLSIHKLIALHRRNLKEEINLAKLRLDWKTAEEKLKFLSDNDSFDHENLIHYGEFLYSQNEFDKARGVYENSLKIYRELAAGNPKAFASNLANVLYHSGVILKTKFLYKEAEDRLKEAITLYAEANNDDGLFARELGESMSALAALHGDKQLFKQAEAEFRKAFVAVKPLEKINIRVYEEAVSGLQANLALLYLHSGKYKSADSLFKSALSSLKKYDSLNILSNQLSIAEIQNYLGYLYLHQGKNEAAEVVLQNALAVCKKYQKTSPGIYDLLLAHVLANLGSLYTKTAYLGTYGVEKQDSTLARNYLEESRNTIKRIADASPDVYQPYLAEIDERLSFFFTEINDRDSAELFYTEAVLIYDHYSTLVPEMFELRFAVVQRELGKIYQWRSSISAMIVFNKALSIFKRYVSVYPVEMEEEIAATLYEIAYTFDNSGQISTKADHLNYQKKLLAQYKELVALYTGLNKKTGDKYTEKLKDLSVIITTTNKEIARLQIEDPAVYPVRSEIEKAEYELSGLQYDIQEANTDYHKLMLLKYLVQRKLELIRAGKFTDVISLGHDYNNLSWFLILSRKFGEAETAARNAVEPGVKKPADYDKEIEYAKANLAVSLLLQNKFEEAKKLYGSLKDKSYTDGRTYVSMFLDDINELKMAGFTHPDFERIKTFLVE